MGNWKDEALEKYALERFKQTMPYQYEVTRRENAKKEHGDEKDLTGIGTIVYFPDQSRDILDFSTVTTEYTVFVSRDGIMESNLLMTLLADANGADIIYGDEDFLSDSDELTGGEDNKLGTLRTPWLKPDFSPDTLMSFPYIETYFAVRTEFAKKMQLPDKAPKLADTVRLYDFLLRALEMTGNIKHVPVILYHRFMSDTFSETESDTGKKNAAQGLASRRNVKRVKLKDPTTMDGEIYTALMDRYLKPDYRLCREAAVKRLGLNVIPEAKEGSPLVSIIIPSKDQPEMLRRCIESILKSDAAIKYEIIVVDNGSSEKNKETIETYLNGIKDVKTKYGYEECEFNFSEMCNAGAKVAAGDYLLFMNDDIIATDTGFLKKMLTYASLPHVGAVGVKLLYPEGKLIQHIGVTNIDRGPCHKLSGCDDSRVYYFARNRYVWDVLAVTGACLMVAKEKFFNAGGFDVKMKIGYNDIDLCVKLYEKGYYNVVNNECALIHEESVSRGVDGMSETKAMRLKGERASFYSKHSWLKGVGDPFYHKMLDNDTIDYRFTVAPEHQITDFRNEVMTYKALPAKPSDKIEFTIEFTGVERGIGMEVEDAYVIEGWSFVKKSDNALMNRYLILCPVDEEGKNKKEHIEVKMSPKFRSDVSKVFADEENVDLAGFVCRIPFTKLEPDTRYRIGVCAKAMGGFGRYALTLGDLYEPGRGIIKETN